MVAAGLAFIGGIVVGADSEDARRAAARDFAQAWQRGDYEAMHQLLAPAAQRDVPLDRFAAAYRRAAGTSTLSAIEAGRPGEPGPDGVVRVPMTVRTRVFGTVQQPLDLAIDVLRRVRPCAPGGRQAGDHAAGAPDVPEERGRSAEGEAEGRLSRDRAHERSDRCRQHQQGDRAQPCGAGTGHAMQSKRRRSTDVRRHPQPPGEAENR